MGSVQYVAPHDVRKWLELREACPACKILKTSRHKRSNQVIHSHDGALGFLFPSCARKHLSLDPWE